MPITGRVKPSGAADTQVTFQLYVIVADKASGRQAMRGKRRENIMKKTNSNAAAGYQMKQKLKFDTKSLYFKARAYMHRMGCMSVTTDVDPP